MSSVEVLGLIKPLLCHFSVFSVITPLRTKYLVDALWIYVNAIPQTCSCSLEEWKMISKLLVQCAAKESDGKHSFC